MRRPLLTIGFPLLVLAACSAPSDPRLEPGNFSTRIENPYFTLSPGTRFAYRAETPEGIERIEITIPGETKEILGIETLVYVDKVWLNDVLVEDTRDYLAQDREGNVWYFGEDVDNYEDGVLTDHEGSWIAGEGGAEPGIWMEGSPNVGDVYRQEYLPGIAEDMAQVLSVTETVTIGERTYENCLKTYDTTPLDLNAKEYKTYCPEVGGLVLEEDAVEGTRTELTN